MNRLFFSVSHKVSPGPYAGGIPLTAFFYPLMTGWMQHMAHTFRSDTSQSFKALAKRRDMVSDRFFYSTNMKAFP